MGVNEAGADQLAMGIYHRIDVTVKSLPQIHDFVIFIDKDAIT
jgi:hypothetical protein